MVGAMDSGLREVEAAAESGDQTQITEALCRFQEILFQELKKCPGNEESPLSEEEFVHFISLVNAADIVSSPQGVRALINICSEIMLLFPGIRTVDTAGSCVSLLLQLVQLHSNCRPSALQQILYGTAALYPIIYHFLWSATSNVGYDESSLKNLYSELIQLKNSALGLSDHSSDAVRSAVLEVKRIIILLYSDEQVHNLPIAVGRSIKLEVQDLIENLCTTLRDHNSSGSNVTAAVNALTTVAEIRPQFINIITKSILALSRSRFAPPHFTNVSQWGRVLFGLQSSLCIIMNLPAAKPWFPNIRETLKQMGTSYRRFKTLKTSDVDMKRKVDDSIESTEDQVTEFEVKRRKLVSLEQTDPVVHDSLHQISPAESVSLLFDTMKKYEVPEITQFNEMVDQLEHSKNSQKQLYLARRKNPFDGMPVLQTPSSSLETFVLDVLSKSIADPRLRGKAKNAAKQVQDTIRAYIVTSLNKQRQDAVRKLRLSVVPPIPIPVMSSSEKADLAHYIFTRLTSQVCFDGVQKSGKIGLLKSVISKYLLTMYGNESVFSETASEMRKQEALHFFLSFLEEDGESTHSFLYTLFIEGLKDGNMNLLDTYNQIVMDLLYQVFFSGISDLGNRLRIFLRNLPSMTPEILQYLQELPRVAVHTLSSQVDNTEANTIEQNQSEDVSSQMQHLTNYQTEFLEHPPENINADNVDHFQKESQIIDSSASKMEIDVGIGLEQHNSLYLESLERLLPVFGDVLLNRPANRTQMIFIVLSFAESDSIPVSKLAIKFISEVLYENMKTRDFIENEIRSMFTQSLSVGDYTQLESLSYVPQFTSHIRMFFELCKKNHGLLSEIVSAFASVEDRQIRSLFSKLEESVNLTENLPMTSPYLLEIFPNRVDGAELFVLQLLHKVTAQKFPANELVQAIQGYFSIKPDIRFLIPILPGLRKEQILEFVSKIITLSAEHVRIAMGKLVNTASCPVSPSELMVHLHMLAVSKTSKLFKEVKQAIQICLGEKSVANSHVLGVVLQQLVDKVPMPILFMRTLLQSLALCENLTGFAVGILSRLVGKRVWEMDHQLWVGFMKCVEKLQPNSYQVLLTLPKKPFSKALEVSPSLVEPLRAFLNAQRIMVRKDIRTVLEKKGVPHNSKSKMDPSIAPPRPPSPPLPPVEGPPGMD